MQPHCPGSFVVGSFSTVPPAAAETDISHGQCVGLCGFQAVSHCGFYVSLRTKTRDC